MHCLCTVAIVWHHLCRRDKGQVCLKQGTEWTTAVGWFFSLDFMYSFLEDEEGGEKEGGKHQCDREIWISCLSYALQPGTKPATQVCALTRNGNGDLLVCGKTGHQLSHSFSH